MTLNYAELIFTFFSGLIIGIILEFIRHSLSKKRKKEEDFLPHIRKLFGIVSKIMKKADAEKLNDRYQKLIETTIEEKKRQIALKDLQMKDSEFRLEVGPLAFAQMRFWHSYEYMIDVVEECRRFEKEYSKMENKGLIQSFKIHHKRVSRNLVDFHVYASSIVKHSEELGDNIIRAYELEDDRGLETIRQEEPFELLRSLSVPVSQLFRFGSQLEKQLEKLV